MASVNEALSVLNRLDEFYKGLIREHEVLKHVPIIIEQIGDAVNTVEVLKKSQGDLETALKELEVRYENRNAELHRGFTEEKERMDKSIREKVKERGALEQQIGLLRTELEARETTLLTRTAEIEKQVEEKKAVLDILRTEVDGLKQRLGVV